MEAEAGLLDPARDFSNVWDWECIRSVMLGLASLCVLSVSMYATVKIGVVFARTRWYGLNLLMLTLGTAQCLLTTVKYIVMRTQRLTFSAAYFRGLQTLLACANYAKAAADAGKDSEVFSNYYFPLLGLLVIYLSIVYLVAMARKEHVCFHPNFLVMSVSQLLIVCLFTIPGLAVMRKLTGALESRNVYADLLHESQSEVIQQRTGLRALLLVNAVAAVAQVLLDSQHSNPDMCIVFESGFEELCRIVIKILSYDVPVLATVYVYYWLPRSLFESSSGAQGGGAGSGGTFPNRARDDLGMDEAFSAELLET
ncbi:Hypothetical protein SCF082_LOCUS45616 [Durusdinium trenchii]|uniref:THH1/TOM1/TOM3 domain-containing protein n=1 Tax=Durusdinium trenchii TaxID=1381693 RepID=A0ABP0RAA8_9DINO